MKILAIETSCDETSAAVVEGTTVLSNVVWSQSNIHSKWGGVVPNLAKRAHQERIDWVVDQAIKKAFSGFKPNKDTLENKINAVAVTIGPGLAVALEVGINKAKEVAKHFDLPLILVNHIEGHVLSVLSQPRPTHKNHKTQVVDDYFPALALVASGKHTDIVLIKEIGGYEIIAHTMDDALGEALDKAARMLGFGYPGGEMLEKMAKEGDTRKYDLPIPMMGRESEFKFSYSGLKTAFWKLVEEEKPLDKKKIQDLAASFQDKAFLHLERILKEVLTKHKTKKLFFGGGVSANTELRKRVRKICKENNVEMLLPYSKKLCGDNAAMIGVAAYFKYQRGEIVRQKDFDKTDRLPRAKIDERLTF